MSKQEFLKRFRNDYDFRMTWVRRGVKVIQDNVIFFNPDGTVKYIAGAHVR